MAKLYHYFDPLAAGRMYIEVENEFALAQMESTGWHRKMDLYFLDLQRKLNPIRSDLNSTSTSYAQMLIAHNQMTFKSNYGSISQLI